ncbi:hypothetical protein ACVCIH_05765 [Burkholderia glumae]|uniref:hypothetical protein n=1 Tax=Burkholderia glumae TaxID=337 RepID=UPI0020370852|nr:hypothetical protein [Burkholderia glumae]MCM2492666.1 hypothetical protein [Burkholderia glumae]
MTLSELRKRLREDSLSPQTIETTVASHVNSPLACAVNAIVTSRDTNGEMLRLPSELMPILP